jgi:hypothetical protein
MRTPLTDKDLGIPHTGRHDDRFRDVRKKAKLDEIDRHKKFKRSKEKERVLIPKYKIGEEVVLAGGGYRSRHYCLAEVIDFEQNFRNDFAYYGLLKRTTDPEQFDRIGRLIKFDEHSWWSTNYAPANVENKGIKWLITNGCTI